MFAPRKALGVPEFFAVAYEPVLMRLPWRIYSTNSKKFSKLKGSLATKKKQKPR
jgi:hypothetical protein